MTKAHYIVFHPDSQRDQKDVQAKAMVNQIIVENWTGEIFVDKILNGNEDPFVFNDPWLYSFCHASQLRRNVRKDSYLQIGSKIIFASGDQAENGYLCIDTVFVIGGIQFWGKSPLLSLPSNYLWLNDCKNSELWKRHFKFPFQGIHEKVTHTYEAELWQENKEEFSFLPIDENNNKISIPFSKFETVLENKIASKVDGKYPVLLNENEIKIICDEIDEVTKIKVLSNITIV